MSFVKTICAIIAVAGAVKLQDDPICSTDEEYCKEFNSAELKPNKYAVVYNMYPLDPDMISTEKHWKNQEKKHGDTNWDPMQYNEDSYPDNPSNPRQENSKVYED